MGNSAEVVVGIPTALVKAPIATDPFVTAHWAAFSSTGLNAYGQPQLEDGIFYVEMPPYAPSPAAEGFTWIPLNAFKAVGYRDLAHRVWKLAVKNTWRGRAIIFAWVGLALSILMGLLVLGLPPAIDAAFLAVPGVGLGAAALSAMTTDPAAGVARWGAIAAIAIAVGSTVGSIARFWI